MNFVGGRIIEHIRDFKPTDSKTAKDYIVPPAAFREQMKMLHDSGYHAILPGQLMDYLQYGKALPLQTHPAHFRRCR